MFRYIKDNRNLGIVFPFQMILVPDVRILIRVYFGNNDIIIFFYR